MSSLSNVIHPNPNRRLPFSLLSPNLFYLYTKGYKYTYIHSHLGRTGKVGGRENNGVIRVTHKSGTRHYKDEVKRGSVDLKLVVLSLLSSPVW